MLVHYQTYFPLRLFPRRFVVALRQSFGQRSGALVSAGFTAGDVITHINGSEATPAYIKYVHEEAYSSAVRDTAEPRVHL